MERRVRKAVDALLNLALAGESEAPTNGANMFHTTRILPFWTRSADGGQRIGAHRFWRLVNR